VTNEIVYLREIDAGTSNACWVVCNKMDIGSKAFVSLHDKTDLRPEVYEFAQAMETKLRKNDHKKSWLSYPIAALRKLMGIEINELDVALEFDIGDAPDECVDISNFAMMLRDRMKRKPKSEAHAKLLQDIRRESLMQDNPEGIGLF
jgi:hypothetical protein